MVDSCRYKYVFRLNTDIDVCVSSYSVAESSFFCFVFYTKSVFLYASYPEIGML